ncbi:T6SS immunity protein Tli4 family protein [Nitrogeniibacter aestuarii]|uniref:T6SS immunity protein Tli4 family protein n=1 Tax=Nitrogeniibacter aestuarii TaxID=2815343 RepID=UPI001D12C77D|nr:T6SS immunity protein Tli4 family protein [Nitrogeniibacter aestuarii]
MSYRNIAMALGLCLPLGACADKPANQTWSIECVGRMQISLPGEADQAALPSSAFIEQFAATQTKRIRHTYSDGSYASRVNLYFRAGVEVSQKLSNQEIANLKGAIKERNIRVQQHAKDQGGQVTYLNTGPLEGSVLVRSDVFYISSTLIFGQHALTWKLRTDEKRFDEVKALANGLSTNLRPRPLFDTPHEPGVCLPYAFIRDDGTTPHSIAMSYRLKDHPDIVINLESSSAIPTPEKGDHARPDTVTDETRTSDFWNQQMTWLHTFKTHWKRPFSTRSVDIAGRKGTASFVEVVREKGAPTDHIYLVVARGNPDAPEAEPDIRLFVEQTQENATKRGITPLTQDEVQALAEQITASVSIRPTL